MLPFLMVNGVLTGSLIDAPIVWYNDAENLGIRMFTIPVEDVFYGMGLVLLNILLTETFLPKALQTRAHYS
jgi:lycopene cyclase domain-containing protein